MTQVTPVKQRIAFLDNARYWLMLVVVIAHTITTVRSVSEFANGLYIWIYTFHMPVFILISGYTSRNYSGTPAQMRRTVTSLLLPYLLVETTLQMLMRHYRGAPDPLAILTPYWLGWFIIALFMWRIATPFFRILRYPILTSIGISLLVGLIEVPNVLALPKVLTLFPFYIVGMHLTMEHFEKLRHTWVRVSAVALLILTFIGTQLWSTSFKASWLLWKHRYDESPLSVGPLEGIAIRAGLLALSFLMVAAILALIPWRKMWTTELGSRTVYTYLLHGYVILILVEEFDFFRRVAENGFWPLVTMLIGALILANLLMTRTTQKIFRPVIEPNQKWMFKKDLVS